MSRRNRRHAACQTSHLLLTSACNATGSSTSVFHVPHHGYISPSISFQLNPLRHCLHAKCIYGQPGTQRGISTQCLEGLLTGTSYFYGGRGGEVVRLLASHLGEPGSFPRGVAPRFSYEGIVHDDVAGQRGFLGRLPFAPPFHSGAAPHSPHFTLIGFQYLALKSRPNLFTHSFSCETIRRHLKNSRIHFETRSATWKIWFPDFPAYIVDSRRVRSRIFARENSSARCRWLARFLADLPFPRLCIPALIHAHFASPSSALKTSMLTAAQISPLHFLTWPPVFLRNVLRGGWTSISCVLTCSLLSLLVEDRKFRGLT
ncbi:hypothetical protein PR048_012373 [Dryococelus australis]|uniref:Uncharacterized protein n=1 Tax=Dryococelus australis TaxID=614101 RepID=A0ABQ9HPT9_9NEOP|nr:hypothetical protein PR048_012373 [Dryococelus australis]